MRAIVTTTLVFSVIASACSVDDAHPIAPPGESTPVDHLSALGIFVGNAADQIARPDFFSYEVNVPLYADGASKLRFLHVPPGSRIHVTDDRWDLPVGTYLVKTFFVPVDARDPARGRRLVETRFLVKNEDGFTASTYLWNDAQTDAVASGGNVNVPLAWVDETGAAHDDHFHVPGTSQCNSCHSDRALGLRTRQFAETTPSTKGQLERLLSAGVIDAMPVVTAALVDPFGDAPLDDRARSYLDANCAHCHAAGGSAEKTHVDWALEHTSGADLPRCRSTSNVDGRDRVIVPGRPDESALLARMESRDPFLRMPRGPTHVPDGKGIAVLSTWISGMAPAGCDR